MIKIPADTFNLKRDSSTHKSAFLLFVLLIVVCVTALYYNAFGQNITGFYRIGELFPKSPFLQTRPLKIAKNQVGYDGQMFLTLGLDPLMKDTGTLKALDNPRYRARRILLPALTHLIGFGDYQLIPYVLVAINMLSIFALILLYSIYSNQWGARSFLAAAIPGIWIALGFSTSELLANILAVVSYVLYQKGRHFTAMVAISFACLAKETMIIFFIAYLVVYLREKNWRIIFKTLVAFFPVVSWHLYLINRFSLSGKFQESHNFTLPFSGILGKLNQLFFENVNKNEYAFFFILLAAVLLLATRLRSNWQSHPVLFWASLAYITLFGVTSSAIFVYHLSYNRVFIPIFIILLLTQKKEFTKIDKLFWGGSALIALRVIYWIVH